MIVMPKPKPKYGRPHRRVKEQFRPAVEAGTVSCWRCGKLIHPYESWDLGHIDGDPTAYAGPEHQRCNRRTATHKAQRRQGPARWRPGVDWRDWRSSYPPEWPPDPCPQNTVTFWGVHWSGSVFDPRCRACRTLGKACAQANAGGYAA